MKREMLMKRYLNRIVSAALALVLLAALVVGSVPVGAVSVNYVYSGTNIYNWGHRETVATFLSPNAEKFYEDNNITYDALSALSGSADLNSVSSSPLYQRLKKLMTDNHSKITTYGETRYLFLYTDCQDSAQYSKKISSFYSGKEIGPSWDSGSTWNREHTWPNSKGSGDGENDIMMLRPTSTSENGGRRNTAYGESAGYYDPNRESNGAHNLHGDVARILLYVYVRWGNTGRMWGSSGVMESLDVLLKWMEEDPVDTWELGRNDSVEAITGTRNVFVDYPELVFLLFGKAVPTDMQTPSGEAANAQPVPTVCQHKNTVKHAAKAATCTEKGYTEGVYCNDCKTYISGRTTLSATGHSYTATVTPPTATEDGFTTHTCGACGHSYKDTVVPALGVSYTVTFSVPESVTAVDDLLCNKSGITLPKADTPAGDKNAAFVGWAIEAVADTTTEPQLLKSGDKYVADGDIRLVAVYSYTVEGQTFYTSTVTCGHSKTKLQGDYRPSCSSAGYSGDTVCVSCGEIITAGSEVAAKGHALNPVAGKPATMEETGIADHFKCSACGKLFDADGKQVKSGDLILDKLTEAPEEPEAPKEPVDETIVIIGVAAAAVLAGVCVVVIVRHKKRGSAKN